MNRRTFLRRIAAGIVPVVGGAMAAGCGEKGLLRDPPPPVFGSRQAGGQGVLEPRSRTAPASRGAPRRLDTRAWVPPAGERRWRFIVLHHSATSWGSAEEFDRIHRARGWDELGYHFVIGNGSGSADGCVEVGSRWGKQKHGAHCKVASHPEYNDFGIGVCLVGNFDETRPSEAQTASCAALVKFLMVRYRVPASRVYGHEQLKATACPGKHFPYKDLFRRLR